MIKFENTEVLGWEHAIRGMRNPMNSWERSDSWFTDNQEGLYNIIGDLNDCVPDHIEDVYMGENDHDLMMRLAKGGPVHAKYRRMIAVYVDITAPLYWWKEFDTYKVGTVANSCSTMHKIAAKEFTLEDFSYEHLDDTPRNSIWVTSAKVDENEEYNGHKVFATTMDILKYTIEMLNAWREEYLETKDKKSWWQMIQLLPSSYNQKRTILMNYEVLANMYKSRKNHKLDEWHDFCDWIRSLPYSELITGEEDENTSHE